MQCGIVSCATDKQAQLAESELPEELAADSQIPRVHRLGSARDTITSGEVGAIGIIIIRSLDLVDSAGQIITRVFRPEIDQGASSFLLDGLQGGLKDVATGMVPRVEDVTKHIATMDTHTSRETVNIAYKRLQTNWINEAIDNDSAYI